MPNKGRASVTTIGRVPEWPQQLVVAHLDPDTGQLSCGFEGGYRLRLPLSRLGIPNKPRIVGAAPDELWSGIVLLREDGSTTDCGADFVLEVVSGNHEPASTEASGDDLAERVALRLRSYRERHNLTQRAMAKRLEMAPSNYHRLEAGRHPPTSDTLLRVADAIEIPLGRLVGA